MKEPGPRHYFAIASLSLSVLLFEVLITRVLSVTLSYHFAFLAVSLAMLGLSAPGVWFSLKPPGTKALRDILWASSLSFPVVLFAIARFGAALRLVSTFWVACLLVPLLAVGSAICVLLLRATGESVGRMYAADLAGAALGAVLVAPLLHGLPTPSVLAALGLFPLMALALLYPPSRPRAGLAALALSASVAWGAPYQLHYTRFYIEQRPPLYERWTATARVAIYPTPPRLSFIGWGVGTRASTHALPQLWLDQDGSAGTPILRHARGNGYPQELLFDVTAAPFELGLPRQACIVGGGGGRDILTALAAGVPRVDVVEINEFIVDAVSRTFGSFSGDPYHLPGVRVFVGEGRHHFSRSGPLCDVLQISLIDTFAATSAGAYALTENGLYTVEAIRAFWSRLSPHGVLSISRWVEGPGRFEAPRLALLELEALRQQGVTDPLSHLVVLKAGATANTLVFRSAPDEAKLAEITSLENRRGFERLWPLDATAESRSNLSHVLRHGPAAFERLGIDLSPSTDDRPFFFQTTDFLVGSETLARQGAEQNQSVGLLRRLVVLVTLLTLALFFLPVTLGATLPRGLKLRAGTAYFASLGLGFMFIEIPLLQRLALYLGQPTYASAVVLGAMLLGAGLGASVAGRVPPRHRPRVLMAVPVVIALIVLPLMGPVTTLTLGWTLPARITVTTLGVFLAGCAMGLPLPLGIGLFENRDRSWYWAINGASSVLASVLSLVLALLVGFTNVTLIALACYALAALSLPRLMGSGRT